MEESENDKNKENTPNKRSKIWKYFDKLDKNEDKKVYTKCKIDNCGEKLLYHQSTTAMISHVETKHLQKYAEYLGKSEENPQQSTLNSLQFKFKALTSEKSKQITDALVTYICEDMKPLNTVE